MTTPKTAVVQTIENEQTLVNRARNAVTSCNWTIGECAAAWCQRHANGRTDEDFAQLISVSRTRVNDCRLVFQHFAAHAAKSVLTWSHFRAALNWDDADECLAWAADNAASIREMELWRRIQHGETLLGSQPAATETSDTLEAAVAREGLDASGVPPVTVTERDPAETPYSAFRADAGGQPRDRTRTADEKPARGKSRIALAKAFWRAGRDVFSGLGHTAAQALMNEMVSDFERTDEVEEVDEPRLQSLLSALKN